MIYPEYIKGTSLHGYYNQMVAVNAFPSRFLLSDRSKRYPGRRTPVYLAPYLTESYTAGLDLHLSEMLPESVLEQLRESAKSAIGPFDPYSVTTFDAIFDKELKYCPECIRNGEHYYYQQLITEDTCRKHGENLVKCCPACGGELKPTLEVTELDPYICPRCYIRYADFKSSIQLVNKLFSIKENEVFPEQEIRYKELSGHIAMMSDAVSFNNNAAAIKTLQEYLRSGIRPDDAIVVKKGTERDISLPALVFPYVGGELGKSPNRTEMAEFIDENEADDATAEQRASAYLVRKLIDNWNPRRLEISPLKGTSADIRTALKDTGMRPDKGIIKAILEYYLAELYTDLVAVFRAHPEDMLALLIHQDLIHEPSYSIMILEDDINYYIYLYK